MSRSISFDVRCHSQVGTRMSFFLGASYLGSNEFHRAIERFNAELATPNPHPRCNYYYAIALVSLGRPDKAIAQFNQSLSRNPKDADALYQLGRLHMNGSLEAIQKLTDLDPDSFQLHALMGKSTLTTSAMKIH